MDPLLKIILLIAILIESARAELKLLNVIFRHGDRTPDDNGLELYPLDPYANDTFLPIGLGGLTNAGKRREYSLGEYLRKNYGDFLGDTYIPKEVSARSTDVARTKMSLQLLLAALYKPKRGQKWSRKLNWQPIPIFMVPKLNDTLMIPEECPKYLEAREVVEQLPEVKAKLQSFDSFMKYLTVKTGKTIADSNDMYFLYHDLVSEQALNLSLPKWTEDIFPRGRLLDGCNLEYEIFSYNTEMKRLNGGMLLRRVIDDMVAYTDGSLDRNQKIFLYSGHETNVASVLQALDVYYPHVPPYSSAVIFELHEIDNEYYVKVIYYKGIVDSGEKIAERMNVPNCSTQCSLNRFKNVLKNVTATDSDVISCDKETLRQRFARNEIHVAPGIIIQIVQKFDAEDNLRKKLLY